MDSVTVFAWAILTYVGYALFLGMVAFWVPWLLLMAACGARYAFRRRRMRHEAYEAPVLVFSDWPREAWDDEPTSLMDDLVVSEERRVH